MVFLAKKWDLACNGTAMDLLYCNMARGLKRYLMARLVGALAGRTRVEQPSNAQDENMSTQLPMRGGGCRSRRA